MSRVCDITGKKYNKANSVSHSNKKTSYRQQVNLQWKRFYIVEEKRWVRLRVSTRAIKTITKYGFTSALRRYGTDLSILN